MDTSLLPAVATTFEMVAALASASAYLAVGIAALLRRPGDIRARLFLATAVASAPAYLVTVLLWARGQAATFTRPVITLVGLSLMMGSLTLFHFTQVFPWRRPWIRAHGRWLVAGYAMVALAAAVIASVFHAVTAAVSGGSGGIGGASAGISEGLAMLLLLVALPVLFVVGVAVPFGALMSLYNSWLAARAEGVSAARITTFWILISQMAGGVLTILIIPVLHLVAPTGPWATIAAVLLFAFGLLMPLAFAAGVWRYRILDLDVDGLPIHIKPDA